MKSLISTFILFASQVAVAQLVTHEKPDASKTAGSAYGYSEELFRVQSVNCETLFVVSMRRDDERYRSLRIRDACKDDFASRALRYKAILETLVKAHDPKLFSVVMVNGHELGSGAEEKMALAAVASKKWDDHRKRVNQGQYQASNGVFVEIFNDADVGRDFLAIFQQFGFQMKLGSVEKVFWSKANELPFAKKNPALAKSKKRVPYSAGVFEFKMIQ